MEGKHEALERPLHGILGEFRTALREEIDAARRQASSNAVPLVNGRRIGQIGASYQYIFDIENVLSLPGDTPGDLYVPGHASLEVTVVSIEGLAITLSLTCDLGAFVPEAKLQSNLTQLMRKLIERIENLADADNAVGERIRGAQPVSGKPPDDPSDVIFEKIRPNPEQQEAIASALGRNTTFVWGPPGTGKSRTIGMMGAAFFRRNRSLLLVSHTNNAVDQALLHIADLVAPEAIAVGHVLRVGIPKDERVSGDLLLSTHVAKWSEELTSRLSVLQSTLKAATDEVQQINRVIEICEWAQEAKSDIRGMDESLTQIKILEKSIGELKECRRRLEFEKPRWEQALAKAREAMDCDSKAATLEHECELLLVHIHERETTVKKTAEALQAAESLLAEIRTVGGLWRWWRGLPTLEEQEANVAHGRQQRDEVERALVAEQRRMQGVRDEHRKMLDVVLSFRRDWGGEPGAVSKEGGHMLEKLKTTAQRITELAREHGARLETLNVLLSVRLQGLCEWGLAQPVSGSAERMLGEIQTGFQRASEITAQSDLGALRPKRDAVNDAIRGIDCEIASIELALKEVEKRVIADAKVVATTLTRAYLRDAIQSRRFDTVILDEASMAPIPALWVAASIATENGVVVGDFKQLPPIVLSTHDLAKKWLGRDIFEEAGLLSRNSHPPSHFVKLRRQYRMHPHISAIVNSLVYDGLLIDDHKTQTDGDLGEWYETRWGHDAPVLLVDTESAHAWVTSVARGARASRLNFLSATICVDIARQLLRVYPKNW